MTGRRKFKKYKSILLFLSFIFKIFGKKGNTIIFNIIRNTNGKIGLLLRYVVLRNLSSKVGDNVSIHPGCYLFNFNKIEFGSNVSIHPMCYLEGAGGIIIGNDVSIAHSTSLLSTNHTWEDLDSPIKYNVEIKAPIVIKEDVWIGCGVRVLSGVTIESRSVVAAGAVVNKNVECNSLVGGIPAKLIKRINEE